MMNIIRIKGAIADWYYYEIIEYGKKRYRYVIFLYGYISQRIVFFDERKLSFHLGDLWEFFVEDRGNYFYAYQFWFLKRYRHPQRRLWEFMDKKKDGNKNG